ncbi:MAG: hypothetical protein J5689_02470 [Clostridia bacterium]|nr:hypothetical protein [Clostridia bacterium]
MELDITSQANLNLINIQELRALGASIGVRAPSTLKKPELIEKITAIITGKTLPELKKDNRGRPSKQRDISKFHEMGLSFDSIYNPAMSSVASQHDENSYLVGNDLNYLTGFAIKGKTGFKIKKFPYVDSADDAFVSEGLSRDYGLKDYDEVKYLLVNKNAQIKEVSKIASVNGQELSEAEIIFNRLNEVENNAIEKIALGSKTIKVARGKRTIVFDNPTYQTNESDALCFALAKKDNRLVINLKVDKERETNQESGNIEDYCALVTDDPRKVDYLIKNAIISAKKGVTEGKQVYLVIDWLEALVDYFKNKATNSSLVDLKRLLFLANSYENNASLSIICLSSGKIKTGENSSVLDYFNSVN